MIIQMLQHNCTRGATRRSPDERSELGLARSHDRTIARSSNCTI